MFSQHGRTWRAWIRSVGYVPTRVAGGLFFLLFFSSLLFSFFLPSFSALVLSFLFFFFSFCWFGSRRL